MSMANKRSKIKTNMIQELQYEIEVIPNMVRPYRSFFSFSSTTSDKMLRNEIITGIKNQN